MRMHAKATKETYDTVKKVCETGYSEAVSLLEQAHALDPGNGPVKNNMAMMKAHLMHEDAHAEQLLNEVCAE